MFLIDILFLVKYLFISLEFAKSHEAPPPKAHTNQTYTHFCHPFFTLFTTVSLLPRRLGIDYGLKNICGDEKKDEKRKEGWVYREELKSH